MTETNIKTENISTVENAVLHKLILFNSNHIWDDVVNQLRKATGYNIIQCERIAIMGAHKKAKQFKARVIFRN
ncbi:MAG: hypothetical protein IPM38_13745 [Ignavibacteria bacterium]|nr:hypothetical protein [Ignavibacteria bacterium]